MIPSLYVHIPFCEHLCAYCDFPKVLFAPKWAFSYLDSLEKEAASYPLTSYRTIYIGGGTPTALPDALFERLLAFLSPHLAKGGEFTCEANPENLSDAKLALLLKYGVNRLSLGIESSLPKFLLLMGRHHSFEDAKNAIERAKKAGFTNLNADLIYGLPGEALTDVKADCQAFLSLDIDHLSAYCLSVNPGTLFHNRGYQEMEQGSAADEYNEILHTFRAAGYDRYEVSNFCRNGKQSQHNLTYWHDEEYIGLGMGASGYVNGIRYDNTRNLEAYLAGNWRASEEIVDEKSGLEYYFLTNLRLESGFSLAAFEKKFHFDFLTHYATALAQNESRGLAEVQNGFFKATDQGILLLDRLLLSLY